MIMVKISLHCILKQQCIYLFHVIKNNLKENFEAVVISFLKNMKKVKQKEKNKKESNKILK